jgi:lysozyme
MASNSLDLARVKRNVAKMVQANAPEADIDAYIAAEGTTVDAVKAFKAPEQESLLSRTRGVVPAVAQAEASAKGEGAKVIQQGAENIGQAVYDRPLETAGALAASTAAGFAMGGGTPLGGAAGLVRGLGTLAATTGAGAAGQMAGYAGDQAIAPLRESVGLGASPDTRSIPDVIREAAVTNALGSLGASAIAGTVRAANRVTGKGAAQALASGEKEIADLVYEKGGVKVTDAAQRLFGQDWRKKLTGAQVTSKGSERLGTRELANAATAPIKNSAAAGKLLDEQQKAFTRALAPSTAQAVGLTNTTARLSSKLDQSVARLAKENNAAAQGLFTGTTRAPTGVPSASINAVLAQQADNIIAAGGERELNNLMAAIGNTRDMSQEQLATALKQFSVNLANSSNDQLQAIYYRNIHDALVGSLRQSASASQNKYAMQTVDKWDTLFNTKFALSDAGKAMATAIKENDPSFVLRALGSDASLEEAQTVFKRLLPNESFEGYARAAIFEAARKGADQEITSANIQTIVNQLNPSVASRVLGKDYMQRLADVDVVLSSAAKSRSEGTLRQLATGVAQDEVNPVAEGIRATAGQATGASLMAGSAVGRIWTPVIEKVFGQSLDSALYESIARSAAQRQAPIGAYTAMGQVAAQLGTKAMDYTTFSERYNQLVQEAEALGVQEMPTDGRARSFNEIMDSAVSSPAASAPEAPAPNRSFMDILDEAAMGGQGGLEEAAPSMSEDEQRYNILMNGGALDPQQKMSDEIQMNAMMDDVDMLIRKQVEEDSRVVNKVSTRQEEGFRTSVYKDTKGFKTIGIGFNMEAAGARKIWQDAGIKTSFDDALAGRKTISKAEAESLFNSTKQNARNDAAKLVKNYSNLGQHQQDALTDMVFQLGTTGAMKFIRTRGLIEAGKFKEAAAAMMESANARQTPNRVMRRAYMLENNVSLAEADAALVKAGKISRKESINTPQELSRLLGETKVAAAAPAKPAPKKRVRYAEAKAKRGLA